MAGTITTGLRSFFDPRVRSRGNGYAAEGRVRNQRVSGREIEAVVEGTEDYSVRIARGADGKEWALSAECSCPYAGEYGDLCKHVWAVLVKAERAAAVDRFQSDPERAVFLISLKAGGVGLNLTAAGYVFLLDPWWNPAVEAQAIDRTHRIGQSKNVIAYRLIAKGTVEERIMELQERKRELAAAIVSDSDGPAGGPGGLAALTRQELEWLLS